MYTPGHLRIFAGQPDPADTSHLTIKYDLDGHAGTIDGWMRFGDNLQLLIRDGPLRWLDGE
jgi:hypothetical protein